MRDNFDVNNDRMRDNLDVNNDRMRDNLDVNNDRVVDNFESTEHCKNEQYVAGNDSGYSHDSTTMPVSKEETECLYDDIRSSASSCSSSSSGSSSSSDSSSISGISEDGVDFSNRTDEEALC